MKHNRILILILSFIIFSLMFNTGCEGVKKDVSYNFKNLDEQKVSFDQYKGKYSILSFTFTRCAGICPMIHAELLKIQNKYKDKINIVSINVDPDNDSPESLKKYMKDNGFDWDILIGDIEDIDKVVSFMLDRPDKKLTEPAEHLPNLFLMDKNFDYIDNFFPEPIESNRLMEKLDSFEL